MKWLWLMIPIGMLRVLHADTLDLTLDSTTLNVLPGASVEFTGALLNPGKTNVFLNGDSIILDQRLFVDASPFFNLSPPFLAPSGVYSGPFFDVQVDPSVPSGVYIGSFTIQGGADANAFDNLAAENFTVKVSAVPEPSTLLLIAGGLLGIATTRVVRKSSDQYRVGRKDKYALRDGTTDG